MKSAYILFGAAIVGVGAMLAIWAAPAVLGLIVLLALIRICWLEDNIISDLFGHDELPENYREKTERRRDFCLAWFGIWWESTPAWGSAHLMATAMRTEALIWGTFLLGLASTLIASAGPFGLLMNVAIAAVLFIVALTRADRLAVSLGYCRAGVALPDHLLLPRRRRTLADRGR